MSIRLIEHDGEKLSAADWSARTGKSAPTILYRIDLLGFSPARALTDPLSDQIGPSKVSESQRDELLRRYPKEGSAVIPVLAGKWEVSRSTLYRILAAANIPRPGREVRITPEVLEATNRMVCVEKIRTLREQAEMIGVHSSTLSRALARQRKKG